MGDAPVRQVPMPSGAHCEKPLSKLDIVFGLRGNMGREYEAEHGSEFRDTLKWVDEIDSLDLG